MPAVTIGTKVTPEQLDELDRFIADHYPDLERAEFIRLVIAEKMAADGVEWSHVEFISNAKRAEIGIPWKPEEKRWTKS